MTTTQARPAAQAHTLQAGEGERIWIVGDTMTLLATGERTGGSMLLLEVLTAPAAARRRTSTRARTSSGSWCTARSRSGSATRSTGSGRADSPTRRAARSTTSATPPAGRAASWSASRRRDGGVLPGVGTPGDRRRAASGPGFRRKPVSEIRQNLAGIVEAVEARGGEVVLAGVEAPLDAEPDYRTELRAAYRDLAQQYELPFIPDLLEGVAMVESLSLPDGVHPNAEGTKIVAATVYEVLRPLL